MTARWTRETFSLVCEVLFEADGMPDRDKAMDVLNALADRHLLVEPGSETREEWAAGPVGAETDRTWTRPWHNRKPADEEIAFRIQRFGPGQKAVVLNRIVHYGPWRQADGR